MPISDCDVRDPRIRRTRNLLHSALERLLESRSFEEVSVQDITDAATLNRATFYDHYNDKFDLLEAMVAGGFHKLLSSRQIAYDGSTDSVAAMIRATCDYLAEMRLRHPNCTHNPFEPLIDSAVLKAVTLVLSHPQTPSQSGREQNRGRNTPAAAGHAAELSLITAAWAIYGAARAWSQTPSPPTVDEIVPQIMAMVLPMLPADRGEPTRAPRSLPLLIQGSVQRS